MNQREYENIVALNNSGMNALSVSPLHYQVWLSGHRDIDTSAMRLGRAIHCAILEPNLFNSLYVAGSLATKTGKEARNVGFTVIPEGDFASIEPIKQAVMSNKLFNMIYSPAGKVEVTATWQCMGATCKGRADYLHDGLIFDLKTTSNIANFEHSIEQYDYDRAAAFYLRGFKAAEFYWVAVEKAQPYSVRVIRASANTLAVGRSKYEPLCALYAECSFLNEWPGIGQKIEEY